MSEQVKRYDAVHIRYEDNNIRYGEGCEVEVVTAADYEREVRIAIAAGKRMQDKCDALHSEAEALRAERERLADELAAIKGQEPVAFYWQDIGYPEPRKHGPYFGWPSESALRNVDGGAIPVPLYTLPPASHDQEGA